MTEQWSLAFLHEQLPEHLFLHLHEIFRRRAGGTGITTSTPNQWNSSLLLAAWWLAAPSVGGKRARFDVTTVWYLNKSKVSMAMSPLYRATKLLMPASLTACVVEGGPPLAQKVVHSCSGVRRFWSFLGQAALSWYCTRWTRAGIVPSLVVVGGRRVVTTTSFDLRAFLKVDA